MCSGLLRHLGRFSASLDLIVAIEGMADSQHKSRFNAQKAGKVSAMMSSVIPGQKFLSTFVEA